MGLVRSRNWLLTVPEAGRPGSGWRLVSEGLFQVLPAGGGKGALQALSLGTSRLVSPPDDLTASHRPHCPAPSCWRKDSNVWALRGRQHSRHSSHGGQSNRMAKAGPGGGHVPHVEASQTARTTWLRAHLSGRLPRSLMLLTCPRSSLASPVLARQPVPLSRPCCPGWPGLLSGLRRTSGTMSPPSHMAGLVLSPARCSCCHELVL